MKHKQLLIALIFIFSISSCKKENAIAELGKEVPNYTFTTILNSDKDKISLEDLKGKVIILEFWATWCGPCLPAMKKLDSLQAEFKDDLEVITVSAETEKRLNKYIRATNSKLRIASDTLHYSAFKYKTIPHTIIIDKEGIVRAITEPWNITKDVLNRLLTKNEISLELKDDFYIDPTIEVKTIDAISNPNYRIALQSYNPENRGGYRLLKNSYGDSKGIEMWNSTIPRLFQTLYEISSPSRFIYKDSLTNKDFPYSEDHQYNFTIEVSEDYESKWRDIGLDFLNNNLDINAKLAITPRDCYVLTNADHSIQESTAEKRVYMFRGPVLETKKIKMAELADYIENFIPFPVLDNTNLLAEYDIDLNWQEEKFETLYAELKKYGLKLEKSKEKLPVKVMEIYRKKR